MIDIHSHVLPGVDDGAKTTEESFKIIEQYVEDGVTDVIVTPHYICDSKYVNENVLTSYNELVNAIIDKGYDIKLHIGNECYLDENLVKHFQEGHCYSLNNSRYVLVEFYYRLSISQIMQLIYGLKLKGYIPIIAHGERLLQNIKPYEAIEALVNYGCYIQINASVFTAKHKKAERKFVHKLFKKDMVHFIASDTHNSGSRGVKLKEAFNIVKKKYGKVTADNVFIINQRKVLNNDIFD